MKYVASAPIVHLQIDLFLRLQITGFQEWLRTVGPVTKLWDLGSE